ncbi:MAG: hypothetical protein RLZZ318_1034 [Bacteroidota bacterium]|jgi:hypothetical protein
MKNILLSSLLSLVVFPIMAQETPGQVPTMVAQPSLNPEFVQFKVTAHDFGNVKQNVPASYTFEFKNVGNRDISLINVQASCGCTTPNWKGGVYKPGETAQITATYNAASEGYFSKNVTVTTSEGVTPLNISGMVLVPNAFDQWKHTQDSIDASKNKVEAKAKTTTNSKSAKKVKDTKTKAIIEGDRPKVTPTTK